MAVLTRKTVTICGLKCKVYSRKPRPVNDLEVQICDKFFFVRTKKDAIPPMLLKNKLIVIMELGKSN